MKLIEQRRQGALFFAYAISEATADGAGNITDYCPKGFGFNKLVISHDEIRWLFDEEELKNGGKEFVEKIEKNPNYLNALLDLFESRCELNNQYCDNISTVRPSTLTKEELVEKIQRGIELYHKCMAVGVFAEFLDFYLSSKTVEDLQTTNITKKEAQKIASILSTPQKDSFTREIEIETLKIVNQIQQNKLLGKKALSNPKIKSMMENYLEKYYWSACNYFTFSGLGKKSLIELIEKTLEDKKTAKQKLQEINETKTIEQKEKNKLKLDLRIKKNTLLHLSLLENTARIYDERKKAQMHSFYSLGRLLKEIARRNKTNFDLAKYILPQEVNDFANGKISSTILAKRRKHVFVDLNSTPKIILIDEEAKNAEKKVWDKTALEDNTTEISGMSASGGKVIGKARIITSSKTLHELKKGEILVTGMTSPDYAPALNKAIGIITDDGGITCHAAIIARELKLPCIVGTKNATRKIKTGDLIELRANHGMARIIEKIKG